jgi:hypothetical protein
MERQNNLEAASEARAPAPLALERTWRRIRQLRVDVYSGRVVILRPVMRRLSGGLQDGLLVVAALAALLGVSLGMSALVRWLLSL